MSKSKRYTNWSLGVWDPDLIRARRTRKRFNRHTQFALDMMRRGIDVYTGPDPQLRAFGVATILIFGYAASDSLWKGLKITPAVKSPYDEPPQNAERVNRWYEKWHSEMDRDPMLSTLRKARHEVAHEGISIMGDAPGDHGTARQAFFINPAVHLGRPLASCDIASVAELYYDYLCRMREDARKHFPVNYDFPFAEVYGIYEGPNPSGNPDDPPMIRHIATFPITGDYLTVETDVILPGDATEDEIRHAVETWLRERGHIT
jgi:hypothetical protein